MLDKIIIRKPKPEDLGAYTDLMQQGYVAAYVCPHVGLKKEHFSRDIFYNEETQGYVRSKLLEKDNQRVWLATLNCDLVGCITVEDKGDICEIYAFYVAPAYQGMGIGRRLWEEAMSFVGRKDIILDLYVHNQKTFDMYKKWGFEIDVTRGENGFFMRHWAEWPDDLYAKACYMKRKGSGV